MPIVPKIKPNATTPPIPLGELNTDCFKRSVNILSSPACDIATMGKIIADKAIITPCRVSLTLTAQKPPKRV